MDLNKAIEFAQLVNAAYAILPDNLANSAGKVIIAGGHSLHGGDDDLCERPRDGHESRPWRQGGLDRVRLPGGRDRRCRHRDSRYGRNSGVDPRRRVSPGNMPIPRGSRPTRKTASPPCTIPFGRVMPLVRQPSSTRWRRFPSRSRSSSLTICGHSLGGALVTLLALDVAANTTFKNPTVYTYASPRTGDPSFASTYNQVVTNTFRIANRIDLVPKLPFPPLLRTCARSSGSEPDPVASAPAQDPGKADLQLRAQPRQLSSSPVRGLRRPSPAVGPNMQALTRIRGRG